MVMEIPIASPLKNKLLYAIKKPAFIKRVFLIILLQLITWPVALYQRHGSLHWQKLHQIQ